MNSNEAGQLFEGDWQTGLDWPVMPFYDVSVPAPSSVTMLPGLDPS